MKAGQAAARSFGRAANWAVGVAAAVLVLISVGGYFYHRERLSALATEHPRLIVTGPSHLQAGAAAEFIVSTTAVSGQPLPAQIEVALFGPDGKRLKGYREPADEYGRLRIVIPADLQLPPQTRLKVTARHGERQEEMEAALRVMPVRFATQLTLLKIASPPGIADEPPLPTVSPERKVALSAGTGVFAADKPLEVNLRAAKAGLPLVVAAYCRGTQVGQQPLVTKTDSNGDNRVKVPLDTAAAGVIRLIVYDYSTAPPKLAAERLVYRRSAQELNVRIEGVRQRYSPGEKVELTLSAANEKGEPVPAAFGVVVVASSDGKAQPVAAPGETANGSRDVVSDVPTSADLRLLNDIQEKTPDAVGLELLLAAQPAPPLMFDNLDQIRANYKKSLADYHADRTQALNTLTTASFFGGLGLVLLVAMLGLLRIVSGMHLWIAAVGATTCCLILGAILMDPSRPATGQDLAVEFASYSAPSGTGKSSSLAPLLLAGPDGKASIRFKLPDAPGTFRVMVDAHEGGRIGAGRAEIVSRSAP